jgi:hypothetical protein
MRMESAVQVWCEEYERLLKDCQITLTSWNSGRANVHNSGRRGRDVDNELRTLQANFAKAWALLQYHENGCEVCQEISALQGGQSSPAANRLQPLYR